MTTTKQELYSVLLQLRETYQAKLEQMEETNANAIDTNGTGYTNHQADDATLVYDQTVDASTFKSVKTRLRQIEDAVTRHEAGSYGECENCGREIDIARLEAIPYTSLCLRCAETRDYRAGM
ncbi:MAG: TraR/DksA C4-type zinc finger protein [Anaerolineae bacterium]|nr:TraR/DksA C4-type zinc finger protein [Anaerolineae bacterium]